MYHEKMSKNIDHSFELAKTQMLKLGQSGQK